jgi:hypothetical protein
MPDNLSIPRFWDVGPHEPVPVEATWDQFVSSIGGRRVAELLPGSPNFDNADYIFENSGVVAELKEIETEFSRSTAFEKGFGELLARVVTEDPSWRPTLLGGTGRYPTWFSAEFVRLFRPHISRVLKKGNRQLRETKRHFGKTEPTGILILVNDGFTSLTPDLVRALACNLLVHSYSSIDCFLYTTLNRYIEFRETDTPQLIWAPAYSDRAPSSLQSFVNDLGRRWFDFLEEKIGPFTTREEHEDSEILRGSHAIVLPDEKL